MRAGRKACDSVPARVVRHGAGERSRDEHRRARDRPREHGERDEPLPASGHGAPAGYGAGVFAKTIARPRDVPGRVPLTYSVSLALLSL